VCVFLLADKGGGVAILHCWNFWRRSSTAWLPIPVDIRKREGRGLRIVAILDADLYQAHRVTGLERKRFLSTQTMPPVAVVPGGSQTGKPSICTYAIMHYKPRTI